MKQNIYDNPKFFSGYKSMRDSNTGLNKVLEQPAIKSLLPDLNDTSILDLGCGTGGFCRYLLNQGATNDISSKMLEIANNEKDDDRITFVNSPIEDFDVAPVKFNLVVSSLTFHYIADLDSLFRSINRYLKSDGLLIFSMEHPIATCSQGIHPGWERDNSGKNIFWQVDEYSNEGLRRSHWIVDGVIKYHRSLSSILNSLLDIGFQIERVLEPHALEEAEKDRPGLLEERKRPPFLLIKARKKNENTERIRLDCESVANHDLNRLLDEPLYYIIENIFFRYVFWKD